MWTVVVLAATVSAVIAGFGVARTRVDSGPTAEVLEQARLVEPSTIRTDGPSDVSIIRIVFPPGTDGGWHSHPGPGVFVVSKGVATLFDGDDPHCTPHQVGVGSGIVEQQGHVHFVKNDGADPLEIYFIPFVPAGAEPAAETPYPGNCPF